MAKQDDEFKKQIEAFKQAHNYRNWEKIIEIGDQIIANHPEVFNPWKGVYVEACNERGVKRIMLKQYDQAIDDFNKAIYVEPNSAQSHNNRGNAYGKLKQYDRAMEDFNKASELKPNRIEIYKICINRGNLYDEIEQYDQAITDYSEAIKLAPDYTSAYYHRASTYMSLGHYDWAIDDYSKCIESDPNNFETYMPYNNRGSAYIALKQYDQAIDDLSKAIKIKPDKAEAYGNRGAAYIGLKQYDQAFNDCKKSIELNPNDAKPYINRGNAYTELRQYDQALAEFDQAIKLDPNNKTAIYNRALAAGRQEADKTTAIVKETYEKQLALLTDPAKVAEFYEKAIRESEYRLDKLRKKGEESSDRLRWILPIIWLTVLSLFVTGFYIGYCLGFVPTGTSIFVIILSFSFSILFLSSPFLLYVRRINHDMRVERHALEDFRRKWILLLLRNVEPELFKESTAQVIDHFDQRGTPETLAELYHPKYAHGRSEESKIDQIFAHLKDIKLLNRTGGDPDPS